MAGRSADRRPAELAASLPRGTLADDRKRPPERGMSVARVLGLGIGFENIEGRGGLAGAAAIKASSSQGIIVGYLK